MVRGRAALPKLRGGGAVAAGRGGDGGGPVRDPETFILVPYAVPITGGLIGSSLIGIFALPLPWTFFVPAVAFVAFVFAVRRWG